MKFQEFKKRLIDADLTLPKFAELIKVSEKNLQSYKKKDEIPNTVAVIVECFARFEQEGIEYREMIDSLDLKKRKKEGGGFSSKKKSS